MEPSPSLVAEMEGALASFPWMDVHTHMDASHVAARGLHDIVLYHMSISDLYAAGCPSGARLSEDPAPGEADQRLAEAVPFLGKTRNTFIAWGIRIILEDLYGWREPVTPSNWRRVHELVASRAQDPAWPREILRRANIARTGTELWRGRDGTADDLFQYSLEWAFFSRTQWGQPDIPLYELERTWTATEPGVPIGVSFDRAAAPPLEKTCKTVEDVREAVAHYCALIPYGRVLMTATHLSTDIDYSFPDDATMAQALARRAHATDLERDIYASYITNLLLEELSKHAHEIAFEFSLAAEPLPYESASRLNQRTIAQLAELLVRHPKLRFICFVSSRHADQSLCTLARELPTSASPRTGGTTSSPGPSSRSWKNASTCCRSTSRWDSSATRIARTGPTPRPSWSASSWPRSSPAK